MCEWSASATPPVPWWWRRFPQDGRAGAQTAGGRTRHRTGRDPLQQGHGHRRRPHRGERAGRGERGRLPQHPPDTVAAGVPAAPRRHFDGASVTGEDRRALTVGFFGTSIMEHLEAFNARGPATAAKAVPRAGTSPPAWKPTGRPRGSTTTSFPRLRHQRRMAPLPEPAVRGGRPRGVHPAHHHHAGATDWLPARRLLSPGVPMLVGQRRPRHRPAPPKALFALLVLYARVGNVCRRFWAARSDQSARKCR